mgnify:CR=1 FL=1
MLLTRESTFSDAASMKLKATRDDLQGTIDELTSSERLAEAYFGT